MHVYYVHIVTIALCPNPIAASNGDVMFTGNSANDGDTASYTCNSGFEPDGETMATCTEVDEDTAHFLPDAPSCSRKQCYSIYPQTDGLLL